MNEMFVKALGFANEKHAGQMRKDGKTPYIWHPIAVAELVKKAGYGEKYQVVALLHDTLEDTDATEKEILSFGEEVLKSVKLLTRPEGADERKYVAGILKDDMAAVVKNADKICNLYDSVYNGKTGENRDPKAVAFAQRYLQKAEKYYKNKFSKALDDTIQFTGEALSVSVVPDPVSPNYTQEEMKIYR